VNFCGLAVQKGKFLAAEKFALCPHFSSIVQERLCIPRHLISFNFGSGKRTIVLINKVDLDAAAFGWVAAAKSRSKAAHAIKLARSPAPAGRPARLLPTEAER